MTWTTTTSSNYADFFYYADSTSSSSAHVPNKVQIRNEDKIQNGPLGMPQEQILFDPKDLVLGKSK